LIDAPASVLAGQAFDITVYALDNYGNIDVNYVGTVDFFSTDGSAVLPPSYTFVPGDGGVHVFTAPDNVTLFQPRFQDLTVYDTASFVSGPATVEVLGGRAPGGPGRVLPPAAPTEARPAERVVPDDVLWWLESRAKRQPGRLADGWFARLADQEERLVT